MTSRVTALESVHKDFYFDEVGIITLVNCGFEHFCLARALDGSPESIRIHNLGRASMTPGAARHTLPRRQDGESRPGGVALGSAQAGFGRAKHHE